MTQQFVACNTILRTYEPKMYVFFSHIGARPFLKFFQSSIINAPWFLRFTQRFNILIFKTHVLREQIQRFFRYFLIYKKAF